MERLLITIISITVTMSLVIAIVFCTNYCFIGYSFDNEQVTVLDYESNYYIMHCNAVADILATEGTNKMAKRKIETYLEITGAKIQ